MSLDFNSGNGWGLQNEVDKIKTQLILLAKAKNKATGRNLKIIEKRIKRLENGNEKLITVITARIQLHVLDNRMECARYRKFWPEYRKRCKKLREMAF